MLNTANKLRVQDAFARLVGRWFIHPGAFRLLTFHDVRDGHRVEEGAITAGQLAGFLAWLQREQYATVTLGEALTNWPAITARRKTVALTFDDGLLNHWETVRPLLKQHGMNATFFVPTDFVAERRAKRALPVAQGACEHWFMGWEELRSLVQDGFEIGSHGCGHRLIGSLETPRARWEVRESKRVLEEQLGRPVACLAYPFGQRGAFSPASRALVFEAGYQGACTQMGSTPNARSDPFELPRLDVNGHDDPGRFERKMAGAYDLWYRLRPAA